MTCSDNINNLKTDDRSVISVIRDIQQGGIEAKSLAIEDRKRCVEHLAGDGYTVAEIAEILQVTDRTIARDKAAIRQANSVESDPQMAAQMVGQLHNQADTCIQRIRRVTREKETPSNVRVDGEKACWVIYNNLVQRLQSLGYLPTAPQQFQGEMKHQFESLPGYGEMNDELARLEIIVSTHGSNEENLPLIQELTELKDQAERGSLSEKIIAIEKQLVSKGETNNDQSI
ncbi:MAG: hypothetical protein IH984_14125 [Planctomycetes bacterium]|nr:hypothetical protein [Planctomycetota bacterium]